MASCKNVLRFDSLQNEYVVNQMLCPNKTKFASKYNVNEKAILLASNTSSVNRIKANELEICYLNNANNKIHLLQPVQ